MSRGNADEINVAPTVERPHHLEGRDRGAPGNGVPALFECHSDPHPRIIFSHGREAARLRA
jgi:hypothetical protein